jgi:hypothetical protein
VTPRPAAGQYYVLVEVDSTQVVPEASDSNNVGGTAEYFTHGVDLVATSITGPVTGDPGGSLTVRTKWFNQGSESAGSPQFAVYLSVDHLLDGRDHLIHSGTKAVAGGQSVDEDVTFTLPTTVPGDEFFYLLRLDPEGAVTEASENNNVVVSAGKVKVNQAELQLDEIDFVDPVTGAPARLGHFGERVAVKLTFTNTGSFMAREFKVAFAISTDTTLSLLSDTLLHDEAVLNLAAGEKRTVTVPFTLPRVDKRGAAFATGQYFFFGILDSFSNVAEKNETNNNRGMKDPVVVKAPAQDYAVIKLEAPAWAGAGELVPLHRVFKNVGNVLGSTVSYRYVASVNDLITSDDLPLTLESSPGLAAPTATLTLATGAEDARIDLARLPAVMPAGTYHIGVIIDSEGVAPELDELNNARASAPVKVSPSSLRILTTQLPDAGLDRQYFFRLAASGASPKVTWAIDPLSEKLPTGLTLSDDGTLSGMPTEVMVRPFTVVATDGVKQAAARLVLRVLPTTGPLEITTHALPPVIRSANAVYAATLAAAGGVKPYTWKVIQGALPAGISFSPQGVFSGAARVGVPTGEIALIFEVRDAVGNMDEAAIKLKVVEAGALVITTPPALPDCLINSDYTADFVAGSAGDGSVPVAGPLTWTLVAGRLPDGVSLSTRQDRAIISGKPVEVGSFSFTLEVVDSKGRFDSTEFAFRVLPTRFKLQLSAGPDAYFAGDSVELSLSAPGASDVRFQRFSGLLPPGLTLSESGAITGTIESGDASVGIYNFVVMGRDPRGDSGVGAFRLEVQPRPKAAGCSAVGGGSGLLGLLPLGLLALSRRRRAALVAGGAALLLSAPALAQVDLKVSSVTGPSAAVAGGQFEIARAFANAGVAPSAGQVKYTYLLSDNEACTHSDLPLGSPFTLGADLAPNGSDSKTDTVSLPADLRAGRYWFGVCIDFDPSVGPSGSVSEANEVNNCLTAPGSLLISTGTLAVITQQLPATSQLAPYGVKLEAVGGDGVHRWSLAAGQLPPGLTLSEEGLLSGSASTAGAFSMEVKVSSIGIDTTAPLSLTVTPANLTLTVVDQELPSAEFSRRYQAKLIAVGGRPPYVWRLAEGSNLPGGLALASDGQLEGRAGQGGDHVFTVELSDAAGARSSRELALKVTPPTSLRISFPRLAGGVLRTEYVQPLEAAGGRAPFAWSVVRFQPLDVLPTDPVSKEAAALPDGFGIKVVKDPSTGRDLLQGVPQKVGRFALTLRVVDTGGAEDFATFSLEVRYEQALAITTLALPDAFVNQSYVAALSHNGGETLEAEFSLPCVQQANGEGKASRCIELGPTQVLPPGLSLSATGQLAGIPVLPAGVIPRADGQFTPVVYSFLVRVSDPSGRQDVRGLSVKVRPLLDAPASGCSSVGGPAAAALAALGLLVASRRRSFRRRNTMTSKQFGWMGLALALALVGSSCGQSKNLCAERKVNCGEGLSCDPGDGVCKCGGRGGTVCGAGFACDSTTNTCLSNACAGVTCEGETSCDVRDGKCKCGGTGGTECAAGTVCHGALKSCVAASSCDQVACARNQVCNPTTGLCQCAGKTCLPGQFCSPAEGGGSTCVDDLCAGVSCSGGTVCDPADGVCKCHGVVCQSGQTCACNGRASLTSCASAERSCRASSACAGVNCAGGTTCDPADGVCKCGGPGGAICSTQQVCVIGPPARCEGGAQCSIADGGTRACPGGTSCDPEDGRCKCGGRGGMTCKEATENEAAEVCVSSVFLQACRKPCDPRSPDCPTGTYCYVDSSLINPVAYCAAPTDTRQEEQSCVAPTACFVGNPAKPLHCTGISLGTAGICHSYCDVAAGAVGCSQAPKAQNCLQIDGAPSGFGYCQPR